MTVTQGSITLVRDNISRYLIANIPYITSSTNLGAVTNDALAYIYQEFELLYEIPSQAFGSATNLTVSTELQDLRDEVASLKQQLAVVQNELDVCLSGEG